MRVGADREVEMQLRSARPSPIPPAGVLRDFHGQTVELLGSRIVQMLAPSAEQSLGCLKSSKKSSGSASPCFGRRCGSSLPRASSSPVRSGGRLSEDAPTGTFSTRACSVG